MTHITDKSEPQIAAWQWRQIVDGATDTAIITTDLLGRVTSWNTGASRILGWEPAEMLGQSLCRVFAEQDQEAQLIVKPFSFSDLAAKVRDVLDGASD